MPSPVMAEAGTEADACCRAYRRAAREARQLHVDPRETPEVVRRRLQSLLELLAAAAERGEEWALPDKVLTGF